MSKIKLVTKLASAKRGQMLLLGARKPKLTAEVKHGAQHEGGAQGTLQEANERCEGAGGGLQEAQQPNLVTIPMQILGNMREAGEKWRQGEEIDSGEAEGARNGCLSITVIDDRQEGRSKVKHHIDDRDDQGQHQEGREHGWDGRDRGGGVGDGKK